MSIKRKQKRNVTYRAHSFAVLCAVYTFDWPRTVIVSFDDDDAGDAGDVGDAAAGDVVDVDVGPSMDKCYVFVPHAFVLWDTATHDAFDI